MHRHGGSPIGATILLVTQLLGTAVAADWPQWGGPGRDFTAGAEMEVQPWSDAGPPMLWQRDLGPGFAAVVAANGRLFTMFRRDEHEVVVAVSAKSGKTLWEHAYAAPVQADPQALDTSYGAGPNSTPLLAGPNVCTFGFTGVVQCLRARDGKPVWRRDLGREGVRPPYFGHATSPIRHEGSMIVVAGGAHALDLATGKTLWSNTQFAASYASPILIRRGAGRVLLIPAAGEVVGLDPDDGTLLWRHEHANQHRTILSSPLSSEDGWAFVSAYFLGSIGLELAADGMSVTERWENPRMQLSHSNAVRDGYQVYGFHNDILTAIDIRTGEIGWRHRGIKKANLLKVGKQFVLFDNLGRLVLADLTPAGITVHAAAQVFEGRAWTAPTFYEGALIVRTEETLLALDLAGRGERRTMATSRSATSPPLELPDGFHEAKRKLSAALYAGDSEALGASRAAFERWAAEGKATPLAHYYAALACWQQSLSGGPTAAALLDRAVEHATAALAARGKFPDAHALLSGLYSTYYRLAPGRAAVVGPMSEEHLDLALLQAPRNPRAVMAQAQDLLNSPPEHGGDRDVGLERLREALELFAQAPAENSSAEPDGGHAMAWYAYGTALLRGNPPEREGARAAFQRALAIEPRFVSARGQLAALDGPR